MRFLKCILLPVAMLASSACIDFERGPRKPDEEIVVPDGLELSFASDVQSLLVSGCESCHSAIGEASDTAYIISGDTDMDYVNTLMFIDEESPGSSRLLTKMSGNGHTGGRIYGTDTQEFLTTLQWIASGALP